tara:strand:+ start:56513 stop:57517 length:1005 start_codon:yes stop_codon:yes gene_type:complete
LGDNQDNQDKQDQLEQNAFERVWIAGLLDDANFEPFNLSNASGRVGASGAQAELTIFADGVAGLLVYGNEGESLALRASQDDVSIYAYGPIAIVPQEGTTSATIDWENLERTETYSDSGQESFDAHVRGTYLALVVPNDPKSEVELTVSLAREAVGPAGERTETLTITSPVDDTADSSTKGATDCLQAYQNLLTTVPENARIRGLSCPQADVEFTGNAPEGIPVNRGVLYTQSRVAELSIEVALPQNFEQESFYVDESAGYFSMQAERAEPARDYIGMEYLGEHCRSELAKIKAEYGDALIAASCGSPVRVDHDYWEVTTDLHYVRDVFLTVDW